MSHEDTNSSKLRPVIAEKIKRLQALTQHMEPAELSFVRSGGAGVEAGRAYAALSEIEQNALARAERKKARLPKFPKRPPLSAEEKAKLKAIREAELELRRQKAAAELQAEEDKRREKKKAAMARERQRQAEAEAAEYELAEKRRLARDAREKHLEEVERLIAEVRETDKTNWHGQSLQAANNIMRCRDSGPLWTDRGVDLGQMRQLWDNTLAYEKARRDAKA